MLESTSSHTSTLRNASAKVSWSLLMFVAQFLPNRVPIHDLLLAGLVQVRIAPLFDVSYLPERLGPAASTGISDIDFFVHLREQWQTCCVSPHADQSTSLRMACQTACQSSSTSGDHHFNSSTSSPMAAFW